MRVCNFDISPPTAASSRGSGSELSAVANALEAGIAAFIDPLGCWDREAGFSTKGYDLLGRDLRFLRIRKKTSNAAMSAPAMAQPIPMPAAAPLDKPFDEEEDAGSGLEDGLDWPSALPLVLDSVVAAGELILFPEDAGDAFVAPGVVAEVCDTLELLSELVFIAVDKRVWVEVLSMRMA